MQGCCDREKYKIKQSLAKLFDEDLAGQKLNQHMAWYQEQDVVVGSGGSINSREEQINPLLIK